MTNQEIDEEIKRESQRIDQLEDKKLRLRLKGYYVISAGMQVGQTFNPKGQPPLANYYRYYINVPKLLTELPHRETSDEFFDTIKTTRWSPYDPCNIGSATDTRNLLKYNDFLFTKSRAIEYAKKSPLPMLLLAGITPAYNANPNDYFFKN